MSDLDMSDLDLMLWNIDHDLSDELFWNVDQKNTTELSVNESLSKPVSNQLNTISPSVLAQGSMDFSSPPEVQGGFSFPNTEIPFNLHQINSM